MKKVPRLVKAMLAGFLIDVVLFASSFLIGFASVGRIALGLQWLGIYLAFWLAEVIPFLQSGTTLFVFVFIINGLFYWLCAYVVIAIVEDSQKRRASTTVQVRNAEE